MQNPRPPGPADQWTGRSSQAKQLSILLSAACPSPATIVVHGPEATGKSSLVAKHLTESGLSHAIVQCRECITGRHLFERAVASCALAIDNGLVNGHGAAVNSHRCESVSAFANVLSGVLRHVDKFVLVFDGIDEQREAQPTLLPAMARLRQVIPRLTVVMIVRHPGARFLHASGVPHIYFPPYDREQSIAVLSQDAPSIFTQAPSPSTDYDEDTVAEDSAWLWTRFCQAVWDSLAKGVARDLLSFSALAQKLWRPFVQPIVDGTFGTRDFSKLVVAQRKLFQDETTLEDSILTASDHETTMTVSHELPYFSRWLLCAAYLASFNPARQDPVYFMKSSERKRKKKGGGTAAGRPSKHRRIPRHLLSPGVFSLDRLMSILHAVLPHDYTPTIDIYTQLSTLTSLRLLLKSGLFSADALEPGSKWKVNFGREYANKLARSLDFDITDFVAE